MVIIGGGPGGYEAALVARQLGGEVTLVERAEVGGSAVLTDVVPSKTLITAAELMSELRRAGEVGLRLRGGGDLAPSVEVDLGGVNRRIRALAEAQSQDIRRRLTEDGVRLIRGTGRLDGTSRVIASTEHGDEALPADIILVATGARPRELPTAVPDGERILTWTQLYHLDRLPEHLVVVGSGVTGAEFASAYRTLGADVTLVSSRSQVLPGEDADAGALIQTVFEASGMTVLSNTRAASVARRGDEVVVTLADGAEVLGSHCLMAVGAIPNTAGLGLTEAGVALGPDGHITVDKVSRTSARGVYAAGDCTGVFALASVAAMQGRIAMWHALGDAVTPLDLKAVAATVFTAPEIATVGVSEKDLSDDLRGVVARLPLRSNARAKMRAVTDGFVKLICLPATGTVIGGVVVAPSASELIHPLSVAVRNQLTVDELAGSFTVYPSLSGSLGEVARRLHGHAADRVITY